MAVAIIVCNMSVIVPAILRALDVGDPFMQEDTVDPSLSAVEIARMTSTRVELVELGIPKARSAAITDNDGPEGVTGVAAFRRHSIDLGTKDGYEHRLMTQASDVSLRDSKATKAVPLADESNIPDSLAQVRNSPPVKGDRGIETARANST